MRVGSLTESAELGLALLRRLSTSLADAFTIDEITRATLDTVLLLPDVCRAGIALTSGGGRELRFVSTDEEALASNRVQWCLIDGFSDIPLVDAVSHGRDVYVETVDDLDRRYPSIAVRQRGLGTRSLAALALATETQTVGGLLLSFDHEQDFDLAQRWLHSALAAQVAQAFRKGIALQAQQTTAEQLQRSLMPRSLPDLSGLSLGSHYRSGGLNSDVGGDWYDVIELPDGSTVVALGDVSGKGVAAAVVMGEMRAALRAYALLDPTPSTVLERLDSLVVSGPTEQLVTLAYGVVAPDRRTVSLSLAGHPPPLLAGDDAPVQVLQEGTGSALGVGAGPWPSTTVTLDPGHVLVFYSDGLVRSHRRELHEGIAELAAHLEGLAPRRRQPRELCARLAQLMTDELTDDDVTLLAVGAARAGVLSASVRLPADNLAPRIARRFVRETLGEWETEAETSEAAELCVSELVTNAVIHTGTSAELVAHLDEQFLTMLVRDGGVDGAVEQPPAHEDPMTISGRGLTLVDAVATAWAAEHGADGTTVWFEIERPRR